MKISLEQVNLKRAAKCMTVSAMAEAYGVSRARMHSILGQREVTPVCAGRIAKALGCDVTEILETE